MFQEETLDLPGPDTLLRRAGASLMVLAPHPDDESLAAGGLIQRALARGVPVSVVFVTNGENNPWPQRVLEHRARIGPRQRAAWAIRRRRESDTALRALGADGIRVHRLGWPDGGVTLKLLDDCTSMLARMRELMVREAPTLLVLPDLADRHPDHSAVHLLVEMALQGLPEPTRPDCFGYLLHGYAHAGSPPRVGFALTPAELARKRAAIMAHASQIMLSRSRLLRFATDTETFVAGLDCHDRVGSRLPWLPLAWLRPWLALLVVDARGGERLALGGGEANVFWRDGGPAARMSRPLLPPCYVKLYSSLPSPWIFDGWGWCRLGA